jgi:hypothetical protein
MVLVHSNHQTTTLPNFVQDEQGIIIIITHWLLVRKLEQGSDMHAYTNAKQWEPFGNAITGERQMEVLPCTLPLESTITLLLIRIQQLPNQWCWSIPTIKQQHFPRVGEGRKEGQTVGTLFKKNREMAYMHPQMQSKENYLVIISLVKGNWKSCLHP